MNWNILSTTIPSVLLLLLLIYSLLKFKAIELKLQQTEDQRDSIQRLLLEQQKAQAEARSQFDQYQIKSLTVLQESLLGNMDEVRKQMQSTLQQQSESLGRHMDKLTTETQTRLKEISGQVDKRLTDGFEKTNATFADIIKRLAIID